MHLVQSTQKNSGGSLILYFIFLAVTRIRDSLASYRIHVCYKTKGRRVA
jgi:hypothetical protein